jgi:hypothetical protein
MRSQKKSVFLSVVLIGLAMAFIMFGPWGMIATVQAAPETILVTFTDTSPIQYTDLSGTAGVGVHLGELRCVNDNCNQKIDFVPILAQKGSEYIEFEYKFKSKLAFDPAEERVVVSGTGTILSGGPKTRFSFTGVFQNNGNGEVSVTYIASTPEASFTFPAAPGTFSINNN